MEERTRKNDKKRNDLIYRESQKKNRSKNVRTEDLAHEVWYRFLALEQKGYLDHLETEEEKNGLAISLIPLVLKEQMRVYGYLLSYPDENIGGLYTKMLYNADAMETLADLIKQHNIFKTYPRGKELFDIYYNGTFNHKVIEQMMKVSHVNYRKIKRKTLNIIRSNFTVSDIEDAMESKLG